MPLRLIELVGSDIFCSVAGGGAEARVALDEALPRLREWSRRYEIASARDREGDLSAIGQEMFGWLDEAGWASDWVAGAGDRELEVRVDGAGGADEAALLDAPWELLAKADGPLAADPLRLFVVARRVGRVEQPVAPQHSDLRLMFMAAAAEGQVDLDYEGEEAAILEATKDDERVHLIVEETGVLRFLRGRLASAEGSCEALHLSCHGDIDKALGPILVLETPEGDEAQVTAGDLIAALGAVRPQLVALSACRTAEMGRAVEAAGGSGRRDAGMDLEELGARRDSGVGLGAGTEFAASFARQLVTQTANVLGWDGSVYDRDAIEFAAALYSELGLGSSVPRAAAVGRRALLRLRGENPQRGRHWHLARVYLGPGGGGPLCLAGKPGRRGVAETAQQAFLDDKRGRVPVATREAFVGRRRSIQAVLRGFRDKKAVLVHGMGALGKSSLAARVASRVAAETVVIFERYDALTVLDAVLEALDPLPRREQRNLWREPVKADPGCLAEALESLLEGPLDQKPILLIVDDLERILETPALGGALTGVAAVYREVLGAILRAFAKARTGSRLLLTSRYDFRLADGRGGDLAAGLVRVPLVPMADGERTKQLRAAERIAGHDSAALGAEAQRLRAAALAMAAGNPGLQAVLSGPVLAGEFAAAGAALAQIAEYRNTGVPPAAIQALIDAGTAKDSDNALVAFFARLSFATYRAALSPQEARQLSAATLFAEGVPIPRAALEASGMALGVEGAAAAVRRLLGLGLFDDWGGIAGQPHAAANPLARPLAPGLDPADRPRLCRAAFPALAVAWRDAEGGFPVDPRGVVAAEIALAGGVEPAAVEATVLSGAAWLARTAGETRAAMALVAAALDAMPAGYAADPGFLRLGIECANSLGEAELLERLIAVPVRPPATEAPAARTRHAALDLRRAERLRQKGEVAAAERLVHGALETFKAAADARMTAIAAGQIADILQTRGELDEALRIRREEELPVYDRLGEVRSRAVTMGRIADILQTRGELDEALRIRREEQLPVYDRLGEVRERAVTMGQIADILQTRGELDEALRIRREEQLPVYDRLGEVRSRAVTMGQIADILQTRGELDEALCIRREEQLPVYDRLGEVRSRAVTMGQIADILQTRGELDEALRIRREEQLPVYDRLGEVRSRAVTMGQIADILQTRGELDEALRIRREEQLPVYDRLGEVRERAVTMGQIADILQTRGELDEALRIRREEELPVYDRLGEVRSRAVTMGQIADILQTRGELDEALRIRREEELPVYDRLGEVRSRAVTMGQIADILQTRGELDEALRIRREEQLPVYDRLGDVRSRAVALQKIAEALLEADGIQQGRIQEIYDALTEAYGIARQLGLRDGIAAIGPTLAQILALGGHQEEASTVLDEAEAAFEKLGNADGVSQIRKLRAAMRSRQQ